MPVVTRQVLKTTCNNACARNWKNRLLMLTSPTFLSDTLNLRQSRNLWVQQLEIKERGKKNITKLPHSRLSTCSTVLPRLRCKGRSFRRERVVAEERGRVSTEEGGKGFLRRVGTREGLQRGERVCKHKGRGRV